MPPASLDEMEPAALPAEAPPFDTHRAPSSHIWKPGATGAAMPPGIPRGGRDRVWDAAGHTAAGHDRILDAFGHAEVGCDRVWDALGHAEAGQDRGRDTSGHPVTRRTVARCEHRARRGVAVDRSLDRRQRLRRDR